MVKSFVLLQDQMHKIIHTSRFPTWFQSYASHCFYVLLLYPFNGLCIFKCPVWFSLVPFKAMPDQDMHEM